MADLNECTFIGRLGADPEIRRTQSGSPIANLRLAVSETWKDKNTGERKEKTEWVSVVVFNDGLCKLAEQYLKKGSRLMVRGKLATRRWQDQSGADRYSTEVVLQGFDAKIIMLDGPTGDRSESHSREQERDSYGNSVGSAPANFSRDLDDDIPF